MLRVSGLAALKGRLVSRLRFQIVWVYHLAPNGQSMLGTTPSLHPISETRTSQPNHQGQLLIQCLAFLAFLSLVPCTHDKDNWVLCTVYMRKDGKH